MLWKRSGDDAVSEVVGNLLILVITVALFSVVLGFVYTIPGPEATLQAEIVPMLERTSAVDGTLHLQHTGGEPLKEGETYILISIDDTPTRYKISDGLGGKQVMEPGDTWSMDFLGTINTSSKLDVKIVDTTSNSLLFYTVVQRGVSSGGDHDPIIAYAWADTTSGVDIIPNNDYTTWRLYAVCKDIDGDLPPTGSVTAAITTADNGDGTFTVTNFGAGSSPLSDNRGDGVYMTGLLKVSTSILPGDYTFTVTAVDDSGRTAFASVTVVVSTSQSSLRLSSEDLAPTLLKSGQTHVMFMKLTFLSNGESINVNGIRVRKLGTIADNRVTVYAYWDKDRDGILTPATDYLLPGSGLGFTGGYRDFIGSPLFTAIEDEPTTVWLRISVASATEGNSVGLRIESQNSITAIGVSTPIRILPIGSFPMDSSILTIKGVFKVWAYDRMPTRILTGTSNVRMMELKYIATGETVYLQKINLTLLGTIDPADVTMYLRDEFGVPLTGNLPFDPITKRCEITAPLGGWKVDKLATDYQIYVYFNIAGNNGDTIGVRMEALEDSLAETELSHDLINPQSPLGMPIPNPWPSNTLQSKGSVTIQVERTTTLPTRAGTWSYQKRWLFRCYGEPIEFHSIKMTLQGTIPYDMLNGVRILIVSFYPFPVAYDSGIQPVLSDRTSTFTTGIPGVPLWTAPVDAQFYGWVRVDTYAYLKHDTEGMTIRTGIAAALDVELRGQVTTQPVTLQQYAAGHLPSWATTRTVNGQMYVYGESLIPSPLVDSSQNIPVMRLTFKAEGQNIQCTAITVRKLGTVAMNLVTVRIYHDVDNDTFNRLDGDDVELAQTEAGSFTANAITFHPNFMVIPGADYNVVVAFSLGLGTAGWLLGTSVNAAEVGSLTAAPNLRSGFPNQCLNLTRNPILVMVSRTVPISDRGTLTVTCEDLSPVGPHVGGVYTWMKLTFWAEGENADVNFIHFEAKNASNSTPPADWTNIRIGIVRDANNNSVWNMGESIITAKWLDINGEASFFMFPLFNVKQRVPYNLLLVAFHDTGSEGNMSFEVNAGSDIQSKGQVSVQSITPTGAFPLATVEREVT